MPSSELPITTPPTSGAAPTPSATANSTSASNAAPEGTNAPNDFEHLLAELLQPAGTPAQVQDVLNALQIVLKKEQPDTTKSPDALNANALLDPQALLLAMATAQSPTVVTATQTDSSHIVDGTGDRGARSTSLDLALLSAINTHNATQGDSTSLVTSLLTQQSNESDIAAEHQTREHHDNPDAKQSEVSVNAAALTAQASRAPEVRELPQMRAHVGTPAWTNELADKLTIMIGRGVHSASLQLSPEQLGPLEIRISVQNDQTSVWFGAAHATTRAALEDALPRLRELFAGQGLNLSDAGVFREAPRNQTKAYTGGEANDGERDIAIATVSLRGMVDAYA
ncbi:MAG TPA: flagellar hook-length control protein FliK [Steroidobacteraceae bacterium]|nr:flagellar hook-length control protein FliK [Steroidobacteraceae bacterium]